MNHTLLFILSLVKSAIDGSGAVKPANVAYEDVYRIAKEYKLLPLIYAGVANSGLYFPEEIQQKIDKDLLQNFMYDGVQQAVLSEIQELLEHGGFSYMPVKGILLKKLYPSPELRPMGDGDILIRFAEYEKIAAHIQAQGYVFRCESAHEYIYNKKGVCIELHKHLIPPYNKDYHEYYGDGWQLAQQDGGMRYKMSDNDHYIYLFTHFSKHYRDGGVGPIHLVDLWVLACKAELDFTYISAELKKLQLDEFHKNVLSTLDVWFRNGKCSEITDFITNRVFQNGNFGTLQTRSVASATKTAKATSSQGIAVKKGMRVLFPSAEEMQYRYPVLKKHKWLLPVCWVRRFFATLFFKRDRFKTRLAETKYATSKNVQDYRDELNYVGLDFNFKE